MSIGTRLGALVSLAAAITILAGCGKSNIIRTDSISSATRSVQGDENASGANPRESTRAGESSAQPSTGSTTRLGGRNVAVDAAAIARTLYPGLTPATRPAAVVIVDTHDWPGALAASVLSGAPLHAPIIYSERDSLPAVSANALTAMRPVGSRLLGGAQVIDIGGAPAPAGYRSLAIDASTPYQLAAKVAALLSRISSHPPRSALVAGIGGPPALSMPAAGFAAQSGSPILLVEAHAVPQASAEAISHLNLSHLFLIGPVAAIDANVAALLRRRATVRRIGASGEVANSIAIAAFSEGPFGWGVDEPGHGLVFARTSRPFDAPAAAVLSSAAQFGPLLLLDRPQGVPTPLRRYLHDIQPGYGSTPESSPVRGVYNRGWLIGGQEAITERTQAELDGMLRSIPARGAVSPSLLP